MSNQTEGLRLACLYSWGCPEIRGDKDIICDFVRDPGGYMIILVRSILSRIELYLSYQLIAWSNGISDPFDKDVVRAYWLGGGLLGQITTEALNAISFDGFPAFARRRLEELEERAAFPHHNTSVFQTLFTPDMAVEKMPRERLESANICLVTAGLVTRVDSDFLEVRCPIVAVEKDRFTVQKSVLRVRKGFAEKVKEGNRASVHLGVARQRVRKETEREIEETVYGALACFV